MRLRLGGAGAVVLVPVAALDRSVVRGHEVLERGHDGGQDRVADLDLGYRGSVGEAVEGGVGGVEG